MFVYRCGFQCCQQDQTHGELIKSFLLYTKLMRHQTCHYKNNSRVEMGKGLYAPFPPIQFLLYPQICKIEYALTCYVVLFLIQESIMKVKVKTKIYRVLLYTPKTITFNHLRLFTDG